MLITFMMLHFQLLILTELIIYQDLSKKKPLYNQQNKKKQIVEENVYK